MAAISNTTKDATWTVFTDLGWHVEYFTQLSDRYKKYHRRIRFFLLFGMFIEIAAIYLQSNYQWILYGIMAMALVLAALTIWDALSNYATDSATARVIAALCETERSTAESVWRRIATENITEQEIEQELKSIINRWHNAVWWIDAEVNNDIAHKASQSANADIRSRFPA